MAQLDVPQKLAILADAAKYDASCASSGTKKRDSAGGKGIGSTEGMGICHAYAPDGRCISLLKILLTNAASSIAIIASTARARTSAARASRPRRWSSSPSPSTGAIISRACSFPRASSARPITRWSRSSKSRGACARITISGAISISRRSRMPIRNWSGRPAFMPIGFRSMSSCPPRRASPGWRPRRTAGGSKSR